jgi:prephenate dehydratase
MADTWMRVTCFAFGLPHRPGALARFTAQLQQAEIDLLGLWGSSEKEGTPHIACVPVATDEFRTFMTEGGVKFEEGAAFFLAGLNAAGALVDSLKRIAEAGVNLHTIECVGAGDRFGCFIWADEADWPVLDRILT